MRPFLTLDRASILLLAAATSCMTSGGGAGDAGGNEDGAPNACGASFANCTTFTDATAVDADRTVTFGGAVGSAYSPKCLQVRIGQAVTFDGDFGVHPLEQACGDVDGVISEASPTTTFDTAGLYGYFCRVHGARGGSGMAGAINVVP